MYIITIVLVPVRLSFRSIFKSAIGGEKKQQNLHMYRNKTKIILKEAEQK